MQTLKNFYGKYKAWLALCVVVLFLGVLGFGIYQGLTYSLPMYQGDYRNAIESGVADEPVVLYDAALAAYQAEDYEAAKELLVKAFSGCTDDTGVIPESRKQLGSEIQFLLGNTLVKMQKVKPAVDAYEESLRLDPANLYAKYNLELLQQQSGGSGAGGADPNQPGGSGSGGKKKGI